MIDYDKDFDFLDEEYSPQQNTTFEKLPDGNYLCKLENLHFNEKNGVKTFNIKWQIINGEFNKRFIFQNHIIPNPNEKGTDKYEWQVNALRRTADALNPNIHNLKVFLNPTNHAQYLDMEAIITLKTKNNFQNCFIKETKKPAVERDPFAF